MTRHGRLLACVGLAALLVLAVLPGAAQAKVVNEFTEPHPSCGGQISEDIEITVRGGRDFATEFPGAVFTFDRRDFDFPPCSRITVTFINEDDIRHQFMVHGVFPSGFFLIEVDGPGEDSGTFTVGADPKTRMVHCGLPQHQQKGMKGQVRVDGGQGNVPNILGVSGVPVGEDPVLDAQLGRGGGAGAGGGLGPGAIVPLDASTILLAGLAGALVAARRHQE